MRIFSLILALFAVAFPATAAAQSSAPSSVAVSVGSTVIDAGQTQSYNYGITFQSVPDRYTVEIVAPDGSPAIDKQTHAITTGSPVNGSGSYAVPAGAAAGNYMVTVTYYAKGSEAWEARARKVFEVRRPAAPAQPQPTPQPQSEPTPQPTPQSEPQPEQPVVIPPQSDDTPTATIAVPVRIALVKKAAKKVVKAGTKVRFTLTVANAGRVIAHNVVVCDRIPRRTTVASAPGAKFSGGKVCYSVGSLKVGQKASRTLTLRVDSDAPKGRIVNHATATADRADTVRASDSIKVPARPRPRVSAPVTG